MGPPIGSTTTTAPSGARPSHESSERGRRRHGVRRSGRLVDGVARRARRRPGGEHHDVAVRGGLGQLVGRRRRARSRWRRRGGGTRPRASGQLDQALAPTAATPPPGRRPPRVGGFDARTPRGPGARRRGPPRGRPDRRRRRHHRPDAGSVATGRRTGEGSSPSWPVEGSPTHVTIGLRASRTWHTWLHRMHGPDLLRPPAASLRPRAGSAIWARVISTASHDAVAERPLGLARIDDRALQHHGTSSPRPGPRRGSTGTARC